MAQTNSANWYRHWRRFRPRRIVDKLKGIPSRPTVEDDIFRDVADYVVRRAPHRRPKPGQLKSLVKELRGRAESSNRPEDWLAALYAQGPQAADAQQQMDQHPHGYHDKEARVFELIDFNDTFVSTILAMNEYDRSQFAVQAKQGLDRICLQAHSAVFSDEQWMAIVRGLTREIAVYQAARDRGFDAVLPNRTADAMGIDIQVRDPESQRYVNLDVKTPSSFRRRLEQLEEEGRMTESELIEADQKCYAIEHNGHGDRAVEVIVLCLLPDKFGEFGDFRLLNSDPMREMLNYLIREYGLSDGRYGIYVA